MPRYNRNDYSACDWRATKSDILRNERAIKANRRVRVSSVLGILSVAVIIFVTLVEIVR